MLRKFAILAVSVSALAGLSLAADDDDTPFQKSMTQVNKANSAIRKSTRTDAEFKKTGDTVGKNAEIIAKVGKESRELKDFAEKEKKPLAEWTKLMDEMTKAAEDVSKAAAKPKATAEEAKTAFNALNKTCANCHNVFKKDE